MGPEEGGGQCQKAWSVFSEAIGVFDDDFAITIPDFEENEERFEGVLNFV